MPNYAKYNIEGLFPSKLTMIKNAIMSLLNRNLKPIYPIGINCMSVPDQQQVYSAEWERQCENEYPETGHCPECGVLNDTDIDFCRSCGEKIDWDSVFDRDYDND